MITFVRTATALPGKIGEAVMFAKEIATVVERVTGKKLMIATSFGGPIGAIAWVAQYDNAGQAEELLSKLLTDREYLAALPKVQSLFVPGSGQDQMWKQV